MVRYVRRQVRKARDTRGRERGATLLWVASMLVLLLGASAFAVDLGWIYLNGSRLQRAADSAALAGVTNLPAFITEARTDAVDAAGRNGFPIVLNGPTSMASTVLADNRYKVDLTTTIDTFFLRAIGFSTMDLFKTSTAEYIKPVRLGSPNNQFGGPSENFWAAINAQFTEKEQGDPFATRCIETPTSGTPRCSPGSTNDEFRDWGYYYVIEIGEASRDLDVELYDPTHYVNTSGLGISDPDDTSWMENFSPRFANIRFALFGPDQTPFDPFDNTEICHEDFPASTSAAGSNSWTTLCAGTTTVPGNLLPGMYLLHIPSPLWEGSSKFGIRANVSSGPTPKVYGLFDMSIHVNIQGTPSAPNTATPWLAEVRPEHEGKRFLLDIFDMGDNNGNAFIEILGPPPHNVVNCSWSSSNGQPSGSGSCHINISNQRYNGAWLNIEIPLDGYNCDTTQALGCWWKIRIHNEGQAHDRTTWRASITGNPLRLVP